MSCRRWSTRGLYGPRERSEPSTATAGQQESACLGPWRHGGWARCGRRVGDIRLATAAVLQARGRVAASRFLKDEGRRRQTRPRCSDRRKLANANTWRQAEETRRVLPAQRRTSVRADRCASEGRSDRRYVTPSKPCRSRVAHDTGNCGWSKNSDSPRAARCAVYKTTLTEDVVTPVRHGPSSINVRTGRRRM